MIALPTLRQLRYLQSLHEHGHFGVGMSVAVQLLRVRRDSTRFLLRVPHALHTNAIARIALGPQRLAEAALVGGDEAGGGTQNGGCRAVVPFEPYHFRAGEIALETKNVFELCAAPPHGQAA